MTTIEPVGNQYHYIEYELNRLSGTLVNDQPTLGKATAALWWLGHRELNWALENRLTPNQATGGSALKTTEGFVGLGDEEVSVVERPTLFGEEVIQLKVPQFPQLEMVSEPTPNVPVAYLVLEPRIEVLPMHIYTAAAMVKADQESRRGTSFIFDWYDEAGALISSIRGGSWSSKIDEWTQMWITSPAPETAASVQIKVRWESVQAHEVFLTDKWIFHNSSDVQAWAFPGCGSIDIVAGLKAHLNMLAGLYNPEEFMSVDEVCNVLAGVKNARPEDALSLIPAPNHNMVQ